MLLLKINIKIWFPIIKYSTLDVEPSHTINHLKLLIQDLKGISSDRQMNN